LGFNKILSSNSDCFDENLSPPENSKIAEGQEVVKLDFMILHKLSAKVSRVSSRRKAAGERKRKREKHKTGNINNSIHEASDVSHIFIPAEFDSSREDYIGWHRVSGDLERILTIIL